MHAIERFRGPHQFCSNYSDHPVQLDEQTYPTVEHAFAAAKTLDATKRARIRAAASPAEAKRLGRAVSLRPDWEAVKTSVMRDLLRSKFVSAPALAGQLLDTGDHLLVEGNTWRDAIWGRWRQPGFATLVGENRLGRLLMDLRGQLRGDPASRWPRVAVTGHRAHLIDDDSHTWVREELDRVLAKLVDRHGTLTALSGLATGADSWWGAAAIDAGVELWAYQPFPNQSARWTADQQNEHRRLCAAATRLVVVGQRASTQLYDTRNSLLLGDADAIVAVRDPRITRGGTVNALARYSAGRPVITIDIHRRRTSISAPAERADRADRGGGGGAAAT